MGHSGGKLGCFRLLAYPRLQHTQLLLRCGCPMGIGWVKVTSCGEGYILELELLIAQYHACLCALAMTWVFYVRLESSRAPMCVP
jgi:hypothetical protein